MFVLLDSKKTWGGLALGGALWFGVVDAMSVPSERSQSQSQRQREIERRLDNGLAVTPILGWNSYNHYSCSPNEKIIKSNAQALIDLKLRDLGYNYVVVDCGWTVPNRTVEGELMPNPELFPKGYKELGDWLHEKELNFGVYGDAGIKTCMNGSPDQAGSLNHEETDAKTFESWGADLLKYDNCYSDPDLDYPNTSYNPKTSPKGAMTVMSKAVQALTRPMVLQICNWGVDFPSLWAPEIGNTWRVTNDIIGAWRTVPRILNQVISQTSFAGPGKWLDLDMLQVGNNLFTEPEEQTHFSLWAIIKSPLIIGGVLKDDKSSIKDSSLAILSNADVISYNQDALGIPASFARRYTKEGYEVWSGPLTDDRVVVALVNLFNEPRNLTLDFPDISIQKAATVKNIWAKTTAENVLTSYSAEVGAHGTMLLELGGTTPVGIYNGSDATIMETENTFTKVYARTTSKYHAAKVIFSAAAQDPDEKILINAVEYTIANFSSELTISNLSLIAGNSNKVQIDARSPIHSLEIYDPSPTLVGADSFKLDDGAVYTECGKDLCLPIGAKIGNLSPKNFATAKVKAPTDTVAGAKFVNLYYTNNDIALATAWEFGTNTRNFTISVNGDVTRVEVPLTGMSSELYTEHKGWQDAGLFPVLVAGWKEGENEVKVGNEGGEKGLVSWGADFVGVEIFW